MGLAPFKANAAGRPLNTAVEINPPTVLSVNQRLLDRSGRFDRRASYSHKETTSATAIKALPHIEIYRIFLAMAVAVRESQRGKRKFVENGYSYVFDRRSRDGEMLFWRCDQKSDGCPARLHTDTATDQVIKRMHDHAHDSNAAAVIVHQVKTNLKRRAENTVEVCVITNYRY